MSLHQPLDAAALDAALATLPHWRVDDGKLTRTLHFEDFTAAFAFMTKVALQAEQLGHHPSWCNVWNKVEIRLSTHDAGDVATELDVDLARRIDAMV
jgi:4a-hydroxytetrahydrobiopterin dehydratase